MKKTKQNRYSSMVGVSVVGGKVMRQKRKKVSAEDVRRKVNGKC